MISLQRHVIPRTSVTGFGSTLESWSQEEKAIFLTGDLTLENLKAQCLKKKAQTKPWQRELLHQCLTKAYATIQEHAEVRKNIELLLHENTMTITTGHQLSLGLGPLFLLYKALHVINLCAAFNKSAQPFTFVPVFWLASEDHDFEEVKHTHFFNKTFSWDSTQTGPVGRFTTENLQEVYNAVKSLFPEDVSLNALFEVQEVRYGQHFRALLNKVFGKYGLVVLDGDEPELKRAFSPFMKREVETRFVSKAVEETNTLLLSHGKTIQAYVRPVNLFYLSPSCRDRIVPVETEFTIGNQTITQPELIQTLEEHPERFSPNVLLRPLYQEFILPNVCYIGGTGELAYWTQLKGLFEEAMVPFPLLQTRVSAFIDKSGLNEASLPSYFRPLNEQVDALIGKESEREEVFQGVENQLDGLIRAMNHGVSAMGNEAKKWCGAQVNAIQTSIEQYKQRWQKEQKQHQETKIKRLERLHQSFYPQGIPQERYTHLLHFCGTHSLDEWIEALKNGLDPFCSDIHIFVQNHEAE